MKHSHFESLPQRRQSAIILLAIILAILSTSSCHASADASLMNEKARTLPQLIGGVVIRSADLIYITEQDSEVFAFYRNQPVKELTDTVFLDLLRRPTKTRIIQQSWSQFFQLRTQSDPTGRWSRLRDYLEANMTNLVVFRVPRDAPFDSQYDLYAVGVFNGETVVGVQMFGVAT